MDWGWGGGFLFRIKLGSRSGKAAHVDGAIKRIICTMRLFFFLRCVSVLQFHDLLSQTTSPLGQLDPYTSRSMDMLLPLAESDRRRRALEQDCSISLRSFSERPRSVVSLSSFSRFDHCGRPSKHAPRECRGGGHCANVGCSAPSGCTIN